MRVIAWLVVRLTVSMPNRLAGPRRRAGPLPVPSPEFTGMAAALQNRLLARLARGEIDRDQYRCGIEALAAADDRRCAVGKKRRKEGL